MQTEITPNTVIYTYAKSKWVWSGNTTINPRHFFINFPYDFVFWLAKLMLVYTPVVWASTRENLFSRFQTKRDSNQSAQLQRLARNLASKGYPFKNILDFNTAGDWDCVAAVERLPVLHYSVDFIFLSFGIVDFIVELWNYQRVTDDA